MKIFFLAKNRYELNFNDYQINCKRPFIGEIMLTSLSKGVVNAIKNNMIVCFLVDEDDKIITVIEERNIDRWADKLQALL